MIGVQHVLLKCCGYKGLVNVLKCDYITTQSVYLNDLIFCGFTNYMEVSLDCIHGNHGISVGDDGELLRVGHKIHDPEKCVCHKIFNDESLEGEFLMLFELLLQKKIINENTIEYIYYHNKCKFAYKSLMILKILLKSVKIQKKEHHIELCYNGGDPFLHIHIGDFYMDSRLFVENNYHEKIIKDRLFFKKYLNKHIIRHILWQLHHDGKCEHVNANMNIIAISGKQRVGKDTCADLIMECDSAYKKFGLADGLKELALKTLSIFGYKIDSVHGDKIGQKINDDLNMRQLLQKMGDVTRGIDNLIWCKHLRWRISLEDNYIIISDIRYKHEIAYFRDRYLCFTN